MKKLLIILLIIISDYVFAELPILATRFRKALVEEVMKYAKQEESEAQLELALRYYAGHQVPHDAQESFIWMSRSAGLANSDAQFVLSRMYAEGIGTAPDKDKEEQYFALALGAQPDNRDLQEQYTTYLEQKKNSPEALGKFIAQCAGTGYAPAYVAGQYPVATNLYAKGRYAEALPVFQKLVEKGDPASSCYLARMYSKGLGGLLEDHVEAFDLFERAASNNYAEAQFELARMYDEGSGVIEDKYKAVFWYEKAARNGHAEAQYRFAESEFRSARFWQGQASSQEFNETQRAADQAKYVQSIKSAATWYKKAAEQKIPSAQYMVGRLYASGEGQAQNFEEAVRFYEVAAAKGHSGAQFYLGLMYHAGLGVSQDIPSALKLYKKAADKGHQGAMFYLGNCYCFGVGETKDEKIGIGWYEKAVKTTPPQKAQVLQTVNQGVIDASRELGIILWNKASSEKDFYTAKRHLGLAAQNGDVKAEDILLKVNVKDRRSYRGGESNTNRPVILMNRADVASDAKGSLKEFKTLAYFLQPKVKNIFPNSEAVRDIRYVKIDRNYAQRISGEDVWAIEIGYDMPPERTAPDFNGKMLIAIEFTDRDTSRRYFVVASESVGKVSVNGENTKTLRGYIDMTKYPKANLTDYAVVYGHQLEDGIVLAVFAVDGRSGLRTAKSFSDLCARNRYSENIDIIGLKEWMILSTGSGRGDE
jgi:TPR repeat protein